MNTYRWTEMACVACLAILNSAAGLAAPQVTAEDYKRADDLRNKTQGLVYNATLEPHWLEGGTEFWYRSDVRKVRRFVLVDPNQGSKRPAFDHERLAQALSTALGKETKADALPFEEIRFVDGNQAMEFGVDQVLWRCDLQSYALEQKGKALDSLPQLPRPRPSRSEGEQVETFITFVNQTPGAVRVFWMNPEGEEVAYGTLAPGQELRQHTFVGHVWVLKDSEDRVWGVFEAAKTEARAVVGPDAGRPRRGGRRSGGPGRASRDEGLSPDGRWRAFVKDRNLYLRAVDSNELFPLTTDGQEGHLYEGPILWAPDSQRLVAQAVTPGQKRQVHYVESSPKDQLQPKHSTMEYDKPGDAITIRKPRLFHVASRSQVPVSDALFSNPFDITDLHWSPDSTAFYFYYNQRGHQVVRVVEVEAQTGQTRAVIDEQSTTFIDYAHKKHLQYLDETHEILWASERDGWSHLYLYDSRTGQVKNQVTQGPWVWRGVDRVDVKNRQVWFPASGYYSGQDPYLLHHFRVNLDGTGLVCLTSGNGTHEVQYDPGRTVYVDTYSRVDMPLIHELRRAADGSLICELERADANDLLATGWRMPEPFVSVSRDSRFEIWGVIYRPTHFDPSRTYPVIEDLYAGPQGSFVPKRWSSFHGPQALAELGFITVQIDGMGTSNRCRAFHHFCAKNLADSGLPDRILWMKEAAQKYPYMDVQRVGVYGTSAGAQSAMAAVLHHPDFYKVAVSSCGCHDNRMDKIWWNELWMGWPIGPHYAEQSNVTNAHKLKGKLLLMVGELDQNVDPSSTMQVVNALIQAKKDFDLLVTPGAGHSAGGEYGERRRRDYFVRHLLGQEPPDWNQMPQEEQKEQAQAGAAKPS